MLILGCFLINGPDRLTQFFSIFRNSKFFKISPSHCHLQMHIQQPKIKDISTLSRFRELNLMPDLLRAARVLLKSVEVLRNIIVLQTNWTSDSEDLSGFWGLPYPVVVGQQVVVEHSLFSTGQWKRGRWFLRDKD